MYIKSYTLRNKYGSVKHLLFVFLTKIHKETFLTVFALHLQEREVWLLLAPPPLGLRSVGRHFTGSVTSPAARVESDTEKLQSVGRISLH